MRLTTPIQRASPRDIHSDKQERYRMNLHYDNTLKFDSLNTLAINDEVIITLQSINSLTKYFIIGFNFERNRIDSCYIVNGKDVL